MVGDIYIRNVPTNIRTWQGLGTEKFGNSIFIFEVGGLCIGHLGHLHHELTDQQLGQIGQLDVVMAAVDGTFTLDHDGMYNVLQDLRARIVIPMHIFGSLDAFLRRLSDDYSIRRNESESVVLSPATMPRDPEVLILPGY
jgi:L-ascorbate metabolism protein UlaG (beta-lactamase superfamily)